MAVSIQLLMQDQPPLVTIPPSASLQEAVARMIEHDFSQLPVVENEKPYGTPASFVTSNSIARALNVFGTSLEQLRVRDALVTARTISADEDLFTKMDDLLDASAVLVLDPDGKLAGIVTSYDTTSYFRHRAEDMLLVEDIETTLKDHIRAAFGGDELDPTGPLQSAIDSLGTPNDNLRDDCRKSFRKFCGQRSIPVTEGDVAEYIDAAFRGSKDSRKFDDLTLSDYIQLARHKDAWAKLGPVFGVSDKAFLQMMEGVRKTRNKLMHFRPDFEAVERDRLRFCAEWFKNHPPVTPELETALVEGNPTATTVSLPANLPAPDTFEYIEDAAAEGNTGNTEGKVVESKYAPLAAYLARLPRQTERMALLFTEVEEIIGAPLPAAAREHRSWWANDSTAHVQSGQWLQVNWRVVSINMSEERVVFGRARDRERAYIEFFSIVQSKLRGFDDFPLQEISPNGQNWHPLVRYPEHGCTLVLSFARRQRVRLECYIDTGDARENERIFETLQRHQAYIELTVEETLAWERLENRRACRVALYTEGSINEEPEYLDVLGDWMVEKARRFHTAIQRTLLEPPIVPS